LRSLASLVAIGMTIAVSSHAIPAAAQPAAAGARAETGFAVLLGRWVRPDGGYTITIKGVGAGGKLDAAYANPNPLPFSKAEASRHGKTIKVFLELRAGGYGGSTYTLVYDPGKDVLEGVYYQAVARQTYEVYFARAK
jgi:uncharacterized protein (DUF2147 family)